MNSFLQQQAGWIALLSGCLLTLTFSPFAFSYLAIIVLAVFFRLLEKASPRQALLRGYLFGLGLFASGASWVYISIHDFGGAHFLGAALLTLLFVAFWALFPALTAFLIVKLPGKHPLWWQRAAIAGLIWVLVEYFRGELLLNGFPWFQVAYSQLDTPLAGYFAVSGVYGTGFVLLLAAALLAEWFKNRSIWRPVLATIAAIWGIGFLLSQQQWTYPLGEPITATLIQGNIPQDKKWLPENRIKTLLSYRALTQQNWSSDVIIWPETAIPAYLSQVEEFFLQPLEKQAKETRTAIIVGLPAKNPKSHEHFNMLVTLGQQRGEYKKNHLLPFGEYLPLQPLSGFILDTLGLQLGRFAPGGAHQPLMQAGGYPFAASICYEDAFASVFIPALPEAAYLVNVTNDAWFGDSLEPHQHMQIARARALETGRYLLRVTNTGITGFVDSQGRLVAQAPMFKQAVITHEIVPMGGMTPYALIGGEKKLALLLCVLLGGLLLISYKTKGTPAE